MRLIPLHNALLTLSTFVQAKAAAIKMMPQPGATWLPVDVAVGETAELQHFGWCEGGGAPEFSNGIEKSVFGVPNVLLFTDEENYIAWQVNVTDDLLSAMPGQFKFSEKRGMGQDSLGTLWFVLILSDASKLAELNYSEDNSLTELILGVATQAFWGLYQSAQTHADPVTGLPGAIEFNSKLQRALVQSAAQDKGVALFLMGIDNYDDHRREIGTTRARNLIINAGAAIKGVLRKEDDLYCYRNAHFAIVANITNEQSCTRVTTKLRDALDQLSVEREFRDVSISIGYAHRDHVYDEDVDPQALCMSAEQALEQARFNADGVAVHFLGDFDSDNYAQTHSTGIVVGDPDREQRNSGILWQTVSLIARVGEPRHLCEAFTELLARNLDTHVIALLDRQGGKYESLAMADESLENILTSDRTAFIDRCFELGRTQTSIYGHGDSEGDEYWLAAPMVSRARQYGCLFLSSRAPLDAADQVFFKALADHIGGALDRSQLVREELDREQNQSHALRAQISNLEKNMRRPNVAQVAESAVMQEVLEFAYRVAPTDVSVLVLGESGVGKEVMARTIHEVSGRAEEPLVVVDCGAITHSLIDSELFGRVKGAFTGADEAAIGRIAQAQGGTLFLDEIGELPLDVQSKMLRFVQEKEVVAVGGTETQIIDTRILCATNRDLLAEVEAGTFRADLYYRLQAIQVIVPPLRERSDDLPGLIENLLHDFSIQFDRKLNGLSDDAWRKVQAYDWPGNVRELQNTLLRATLIARGDQIEADDLQLSSETGQPISTTNVSPLATEPLAAERRHEPEADTPVEPISAPPIVRSEQDDWAVLAALVRGQLQALHDEQLGDAPVGRWLNDALVLIALEVGGDVVRAGARILGIPETTLRRQLVKANQNANNPLHLVGGRWLASLPALNEVLRNIMRDWDEEHSLAEQVEALLLQEVVNFTDNDACGAALMGITPPTYKRWLVKHDVSPDDLDSGTVPIQKAAGYQHVR